MYVNATLTLPAEAKHSLTHPLDFGTPSWDTLRCVRMAFVHHTALQDVKCPADELQSVPLCVLLKNVGELMGKGECWCVLPCRQDTDGPDMSVVQERQGAAELPLSQDG